MKGRHTPESPLKRGLNKGRSGRKANVRKIVLDRAMRAVTTTRARQYGTVEDNFGSIARLWEAYLGVKVTSVDVAAMMALLKIARTKANPKHLDSWVDLAGYAACGAEAGEK